MSEEAQARIQELVERETDAWNRKDANALVALMHPDMVWMWPPTARDHDPMTWAWGMGRFHAKRWRKAWQDLFDQHDLVHNHRVTRRIETTPEGDGGFAVVDVDTLWRNRDTGADFHWKGRACKAYTRLADGEWKLIMHTGLLDYG